MIRNVAVIGAAGRIGLPTSIIIADTVLHVTGIDINQDMVNQLNGIHKRTGTIPYKEEGFEYPLVDAFKNINFTTKFDDLKYDDVIFIIIGTPVDSDGNANLQPLLDFCKNKLVAAMKQNKVSPLIILRSTVAPGTTICIRDLLEAETGLTEGKDFFLAFCPERVAQGKALIEMKSLPQIIGTFSDKSYTEAHIFFNKIGVFNVLPRLTPTEAELSKLITNMYRYVNFAFSNEMYMLGQQYGADIHSVIATANKDYPRMNMPMPGPNSGGPCLSKDGKLLVEQFPFGELVNNAFLINEGMPQYIFNQAKKLKKIKTAMILGMTFKKDNDDSRLSLSYKLKKILKKNNIKIIEADGYIHVGPIYSPHDYVGGDIDAIFVMTPHQHLVDDFRYRLISELRYDCLIVDSWKALYPEMKKTIYERCEIHV